MKCTDKQCTGMQCSEAKRLFSPYLDGAVTGTQMHGLQRHLSECEACREEYQLLRQSQQLLVSVGRPKVPADLSLKLRLAISREVAQARRNGHGKGGGQAVRETVGAAGWPGLHNGRRVIATFSNEDSRTTAQPLRNASPPEQHTGASRTSCGLGRSTPRPRASSSQPQSGDDVKRSPAAVTP